MLGALLGLATAGAGIARAGSFLRTGHDDIKVDPALRRFTGVVTALGTPDPEGRIYSLQVAPLGPRNFTPAKDEMHGWRLTMLAGKRFAKVFEVKGNNASEVSVTALDGPLNGVDAKDVFVIEEIAVDRSVPQRGSAPPRAFDGA